MREASRERITLGEGSVDITKLYRVFDVKDDEAGAIKSFNADAGGSILSIVINCDSVADDLSIQDLQNFDSRHRTGPLASHDEEF